MLVKLYLVANFNPKQYNTIFCRYFVPFNAKTQSSVSSHSKKHQLGFLWVWNHTILCESFKECTKINFQISDYSFSSFPHKYKILSSLKLRISDFSFIKNKSFMNMLKSKGPWTDPCGMPMLILFAVPLRDPIF